MKHQWTNDGVRMRCSVCLARWTDVSILSECEVVYCPETTEACKQGCTVGHRCRKL